MSPGCPTGDSKKGRRLERLGEKVGTAICTAKLCVCVGIKGDVWRENNLFQQKWNGSAQKHEEAEMWCENRRRGKMEELSIILTLEFSHLFFVPKHHLVGTFSVGRDLFFLPAPFQMAVRNPEKVWNKKSSQKFA